MSSKKKNLDLNLSEVFKQLIAIKDVDYKRSQEVFEGVFKQVKGKMGVQCNYFGNYSNQVLYAGSVYDGIKVTKLDEFDMDIVIRLPINYDEIIIENDQPGFVKLKIVEAFDNLDKQPNWEQRHKITREWRDSEKYLLQNKFRQWIHGIVQKALNELNGEVTVNEVKYQLKYKESGPAYTLNIENEKGNEEFKLDVDLVPVIRFLYPRWPEGYRNVEEGIVKDWLVVPKPNKALKDEKSKNRCWRLSFQDFERDLMKGCQQLKTSIRLVKKLRDSLQMKEIASYYIKTLFLWKIDEMKEKKYWQKGIGVIFRIMVEELYVAIKNKNIPYYWHAENNLIEKMKPTVQKVYTDKLKEVLDAIDANDVDKVVCYLLTTDEFQQFKRSDFYQKQAIAIANFVTSQVNRQESVTSATSSINSVDTQTTQGTTDSLGDLVRALNDKLDVLTNDNKNRLKTIESLNSKIVPVIDIVKTLHEKVEALSGTLSDQNEKLEKLESAFEVERCILQNKLDALIDKIDSQNERLMKLQMVNKNTDNIAINNKEIKLDMNDQKLSLKDIVQDLFGGTEPKDSSETVDLFH